MGGALQKWASAGKQRVGNRRRQAEGSGALAARACFVNSVNKTRPCSECARPLRLPPAIAHPLFACSCLRRLPTRCLPALAHFCRAPPMRGPPVCALVLPLLDPVTQLLPKVALQYLANRIAGQYLYQFQSLRSLVHSVALLLEEAAYLPQGRRVGSIGGDHKHPHPLSQSRIRNGDDPGLRHLRMGLHRVLHLGRADILSLIHISEPTRLRRISYAVFCLKK